MKQLAEFDLCAGRLKAVADAKRLRIISCLFDGPKTVSELTDSLRDEIALISHHLQILRTSGIVTATKRGRFMQYALHPDINAATDGDCRQIDFGCCKLDIS